MRILIAAFVIATAEWCRNMAFTPSRFNACFYSLYSKVFAYFNIGIFISKRRYNKLPQAWNMRNFFSHSSEGLVQNQSRTVPCSLSRLWGRTVLYLFLASGGCQQPRCSLVYSCITPISASVITQTSFFWECLYVPKRPSCLTLVIALGAYLNPEQPHLNLITSAETCLQIRAQLQAPGIRIWAYLFRESNSTS